MNDRSIEIDGKWYHATPVWDMKTGEVLRIAPLCDEDGDLIPLSVCLCFAYEPSECTCATTSWKNYQDFI